jgi:hypothetical protein
VLDRVFKQYFSFSDIDNTSLCHNILLIPANVGMIGMLSSYSGGPGFTSPRSLNKP